MLGFAEKIFYEKEGRFFNKKSIQRWGHLHRMVEIGSIPYPDFAIAESLLTLYPDASESAAAFIVYLSMAARAGHLCVVEKEGTLFPDPLHLLQESLFSENVHFSSWDKDFSQFVSMIKKGSSLLPSSLVANVSEEFYPDRPICRWQQAFYLQRNWVDETFFFTALSRILRTTPHISFSEKQMTQKLLEHSPSLLSEQMKAIDILLKQSFSVLTGGPGTGKTYTAGKFIHIFWELLSSEQRKNFRLALAAPTGKAASNLAKKLGYLTLTCQGLTLHQLLNVSPSRKKPYHELSHLHYDLIVVDESSMIDASMMATLLLSVKEGARLVLLGDPHQLPPVGMGNFFWDAIQSCRALDHPVGELTHCMRSEISTIVNFSQKINSGNGLEVVSSLDVESDSEITRKSIDPTMTKKVFQALIHKIVNHFDYLTELNQNENELFGRLRTFGFLSPLRNGPYGVHALNQAVFQEMFSRTKDGARLAVPILIGKNDFQRNLMNGDMGLLICHKNKSQKFHLTIEDFALFPSNEGDELRKIPALLLPSFEYGYCLSVHKSQGSEFDHVFILLPPGSEIFGREILYTAATRSRKSLEIWGNDDTICKTVERQGKRCSMVINKLISKC